MNSKRKIKKNEFKIDVLLPLMLLIKELRAHALVRFTCNYNTLPRGGHTLAD
jgi:hypothetical protein